MDINIFLLVIVFSAFYMVTVKRISSLINGFLAQSLFMSIYVLFAAIKSQNTELYVVATLLFLLKVIIIPAILRQITERTKTDENIGLFINPPLSLFSAVILYYFSYSFIDYIIPLSDKPLVGVFSIASFITLIGLFLMIFRMKALSQIIGLLIMENGLFLLAASTSSGLPFILEIAIFFDVLVSVMILGIFVYRINSLFTHIDVNRLTRLKG